MPHPIMYTDDDPGLDRLREIALAFPEAEEHIAHGRPTFRAGKIFAAFGGSEKLAPGDHRRWPYACLVKVEESERPALDADDRFFVPAYWGPSGWRGIDIGHADVDWAEVSELVDASYRLVASRRLVRELDES